MIFVLFFKLCKLLNKSYLYIYRHSVTIFIYNPYLCAFKTKQPLNLTLS